MIVDFLEPVDIHHHHRHPPAGPRRGAQPGGELLLQGAQVAQAGELVDPAHPHQPAPLLFPVARQQGRVSIHHQVGEPVDDQRRSRYLRDADTDDGDRGRHREGH